MMVRGWRGWAAFLTIFMGMTAFAPRGARAQTIVEAGWQLVRTVDLTGVQAARFDPKNPRELFVARRGAATGIYKIDAYGMVSKLANANDPATLVVEPQSGDLFFSEDGSGIIYKLARGSRTVQAWVDGLHTGDDDPIGMAIAPASYGGSVLQPGEALVVDRGDGGPDEIWRWSPAAAGAGTVLHADNGTLQDAMDVAISDTDIYVVDRGTISDTDGALYRVGAGGALTSLAPFNGLTLVDPSGVVVDPRDGKLLVADHENLLVARIDPNTKDASLVLTGLALPITSYAPLDISSDGVQMAVTTHNKVLIYGRCATSGGLHDCDGNDTADACDYFAAQSIAHGDCDNNGVLDGCDLTDGTHDDCNGDQLPDVCPTCPPVDAVFMMDTSASMVEEAEALCTKLAILIDALKARGITLTTQILGISETPGGLFTCLTDNVANVFGTTLPGTPPVGLGPLGDCGAGEGTKEDWGRAVAVTAANKSWATGAVRVIVVVADEGPACGDPIADPGLDADAVAHAVAVAKDNEVIVSVVAAVGSSAEMKAMASTLAHATGGRVVESTLPEFDMAESVRDIIVDGCRTSTDCDKNDVPDTCQSQPVVCLSELPADAGVGDAGADAAVVDAAVGDAAVVDAAIGDAAVVDAAIVDAAIVDGGADAAVADGPVADAEPADAVPADAGAGEDASGVVDFASSGDGLPRHDADAVGTGSDGGCDCRVSATPDGSAALVMLLCCGLALRRRRRP